uniref:Uncharacterized protein n=1 Tax=Anguilla anguilla TaxID=7936 RepID=A0A0E9RPX0_ANGAN
MSNWIMRSPLWLGLSDKGIPSPGTTLLYLGCTMSLIGMLSSLPSRVSTSTENPVRACVPNNVVQPLIKPTSESIVQVG